MYQGKNVMDDHSTENSILSEKQVLLAEDDRRNIFALSSVLEMFEMKIILAGNGKEAVRLLEENPGVDIILMDIMMPEMDGFEAIKIIRKDQRFKSLPIIALTAKAMQGDREKCIEAGANDYQSKPVDVDKLVPQMKEWLSK